MPDFIFCKSEIFFLEGLDTISENQPDGQNQLKYCDFSASNDFIYSKVTEINILAN